MPRSPKGVLCAHSDHTASTSWRAATRRTCTGCTCRRSPGLPALLAYRVAASSAATESDPTLPWTDGRRIRPDEGFGEASPNSRTRRRPGASLVRRRESVGAQDITLTSAEPRGEAGVRRRSAAAAGAVRAAGRRRRVPRPRTRWRHGDGRTPADAGTGGHPAPVGIRRRWDPCDGRRSRAPRDSEPPSDPRA